MAGTHEGGLRTAAKNLAKDPLYYAKIGSVGGSHGTGHEFAHGKVSPSEAGRKGGAKSRRRPKLNKGVDEPIET